MMLRILEHSHRGYNLRAIICSLPIVNDKDDATTAHFGSELKQGRGAVSMVSMGSAEPINFHKRVLEPINFGGQKANFTYLPLQ